MKTQRLEAAEREAKDAADAYRLAPTRAARTRWQIAEQSVIEARVQQHEVDRDTEQVFSRLRGK